MMKRTRKQPQVDFATAFKRYIPAIYAAAQSHKLLPLPVEEDAMDALEAAKLLMNLFAKLSTRLSHYNPDRLIADGGVSFQLWIANFILL